jgi:autotransporter-associated beta strand protein
MRNRTSARRAALAAVASVFSISGVANAAPGDSYILPIDHFLQGNGFVPEGNTGYLGSQAWSHAYTGPGDTSRVYWNFNNPGVPTEPRLYIVEWWDATPSSSDGWQPIESQFNGDAGETYPIESQIPWAGEYGTNHQWIAGESQAIGGGTWRLAGAGPHSPDGYSYNADSDGNNSFFMWLKAGSQLYAKWDFGFPIAGGNPRTWAELRLTEVTPDPVTVYWDLNSTAAGTGGGGGGTTPSGTWNGTSPNFNTNSTGAGTLTDIRAVTNPVDTVVFAAGSGATGTYTVTVSGTRRAALVAFEDGTVTLNGGNLAVNGFSAPAGVTGNVSSVVSGQGIGVVKAGAGTVTFSSANTFVGGMTVNEGTLLLANADALAAGAVSVSNGATARAQAGLTKAVTVATLTTTGTGQFDLTNNSMVVRGMTVGQVQAEIVKAFNAGQWNGAGGLTSSTAAAALPAITAIGFASNAVLIKSEFKGVTGLNAGDILVKYTYYGDSDLNGATTLDDYTLFLNGYQTAGTTWVQGDYDYNGLVTLDDFTLFLAGYQQQGAPLSELESLINSTPMGAAERSAMLAAVQAVPEPTTALSAAVVGATFAGLRRRQRRRR